MILILFGVSGAGKTTIGRMLSARLGWRFEDADDYHSDANKKKMSAGIPLNDEDREPWLRALNRKLLELAHLGQSAVLACSALKQSYRDLLVVDVPIEGVQFALLEAPRELLEERIRGRNHPYMNPRLLDSQLAILEAPADVWRVSVAGTPEDAVEELLGCLHGAQQNGVNADVLGKVNWEDEL